MLLVYFLLVILCGKMECTIGNQNKNSCWCATRRVNLHSTPCGSRIGSAYPGQCFRYTGKSKRCTLYGIKYTFYCFQNRCAAKNFLTFSPESENKCGKKRISRAIASDGTCASVERVLRAEWNERSTRYISRLSRPVNMVFIHHTTGSRCTDKTSCITKIKQHQSYHMDTRGYWDIGYNYLIGEDGRAYEGRGLNVEGGHTYGYNSKAIAISVIGDFTQIKPNDVALNAIKSIINCAIEEGVVARTYKLYGHRDAACTECPGAKLWEEIQTWPKYSTTSIQKYCNKKPWYGGRSSSGGSNKPATPTTPVPVPGPTKGSCLIVTGSTVNIRRTACGTIVGTASRGQIYSYTGVTTPCTFSSGNRYDYLSVTGYGKTGYMAGTLLQKTSCPAPSPPTKSATCYKVIGTTVNIRSSACGTIVGTASQGEVYLYTGSMVPCRFSSTGNSYNYISLTGNGKTGYMASFLLQLVNCY